MNGFFGSLSFKVAPCKAAVFLKCPKEVMVHRLLKRAKTSGRIDDHIEIFEKRYKGYLKDTVPIVKILKEDDVKVIEVSCDDQTYVHE